MDTYIIKRDGKQEPFSIDKIKNAISKAFIASGTFATEETLSALLSRLRIHSGISVEEIQGLCDFYLLREALPNPKRKMSHKIKLLWRPELAHIQQINQLPAYRQKSKDFVRKKILEKVPEELLQTQISDELFERDYTTIQAEIDAYKGS